MIETRDTWRRCIALLHLGVPSAGLVRAMRQTAAPVDEGGLGLSLERLQLDLGCWWAPVRPEGVDRFDVDSGGAWALLLPVHRHVWWQGEPEFRTWHLDPGDVEDVLAIPLPPPGGGEPRGWGGRRWRRYAGTGEVIGGWAIGLNGTVHDPEPRLYREPLGWLAAGAPLPRAAVVLRWSRAVLGALATCRPIAEDEAHAREIARRLKEHALRDLPEVRFPRPAVAAPTGRMAA